MSPYRITYAFIFLLCTGFIQAQEICTNGIDDDGDGLIDLNDPECVCTGIPIDLDVTDKIPNPDFEEMSCCPQFVSEMDCVDGWDKGTGGTVDYLNDCGYVGLEVTNQGLVPFPSGSGALGTLYYEGFKEYPAVCLNSPFEQGQEYTLTFHIGAVMIGPTCPLTVTDLSPTLLTFYGNTACDFPVSTSDCPSSVNPSWLVLGTVLYQPVNQWQEISFTFTPAFNVHGLMFGPPCNLAPDYQYPCFPYFVYDNFSLEQGNVLLHVELIPSGLPCQLDYSLTGFIDHQGGEWQWYFNGVAISGQNDQTFLLADNQFQSGTYQITYTTAEGCSVDSIQVTIPPMDTTQNEVFFCPNGSTSCAGMYFDQEGEFYFVFTTPNGCDSVVFCRVESYEPVPTTYLEVDACAPYNTSICGNTFNTSGYYTQTCMDFQGCDSVVVLDLRIMAPQAIIQPPEMLECDTNALVTLNGISSPNNSLGSTTFKWTGPFGGFISGQNGPNAVVSLPGQYCLIVTFENNGTACADTACVTVLSDQPLPDPPLIVGGSSGCIGDTLYFQRSYHDSVIINGWEWIVPPQHEYFVQNDSTLMAVLQVAGDYQMCARVLSECGPSDTSCVQVSVFPVDNISVQSSTCDSAQAGTFMEHLQNSHGCDSTVTTTIALLPSHLFRLDLTTCDPQQVTQDTFFLINQYGCDSVRITHVDLLPSDQTSLTFHNCDTLLAGLDTLYLTNEYGCDSTVFIETIYSGNYQEFESVILCGSGANYADTLLVTSGPCDSLFITNFVYVPFDTTLLQEGTCDPGQVGQFIAVLPSSIGCDSTVITVVSLMPSHDVLLDGFTCVTSEAHFEMLHLVNQYGCDSVVTIDIQYMGIDTQYVQATTCDPTQTGTSMLVLPGQYCDTVRVSETILLPSSQSLQQIVLCNASGPASDTALLVNYLGCDSLVIRNYEYVDLLLDVEVMDQRCTGLNDGVIQIVYLNGGQPPLTYRLDQDPWQSEPRFENLTPGTYTVYVRENGGCTDTLSGLVVGEGVTLVLDAGPDYWVHLGDFIPLQLTSSHPLTQIQWSAANVLSCPTCPKTTLGPVQIEQTVVLTASTADGCNASDALEVRIRPRPEVYIPNSFSPNNDGINDFFSVYGNELVVAVRNMAIYDRWGNALYARTDLPVNDPSAGWDGTFREKPMDPGVYVYVVEVELQDGSTHLYKGDVTVVK